MKHLSILAIISIVFIYACNTQAADVQPKQPREIPVMKLHPADTVFHQNYVADIQAVKNVEIRSRATGYLESINVEEGSSVQKGQLLFRLSNQELTNNLQKAKASLQSAQAAVKIAELEVKRIQLLVDKEVIVKSELELAEARLADVQAKVKEAEANKSDAETRIEYLSVRAPFSGLVDRFPIKPGSLISEGTLLTTISDNREVYAYFNVSENEYLQHFRTMSERLNGSAKASLILSDGTKYAHTGVIETKESEFSENTGTIAFRARFPNPEKMLKHGASGKIQLTTNLHEKLIISQKSVMEIQDKSFVYLLDSSNSITMRTIQPVLRLGDYMVVEGINSGDVIVYEGLQSIREGDKISPRFIGN